MRHTNCLYRAVLLTSLFGKALSLAEPELLSFGSFISCFFNLELLKQKYFEASWKFYFLVFVSKNCFKNILRLLGSFNSFFFMSYDCFSTFLFWDIRNMLKLQKVVLNSTKKRITQRIKMFVNILNNYDIIGVE